MICSWCGAKQPNMGYDYRGRTWWRLSAYADHLTGNACPTCFDDLEHRDGAPVDPERYRVAQVRRKIVETNKRGYNYDS